jgi:secondary thiamine-phosphate synthase enzyme
MRIHQETIEIQTTGRGLFDITERIARAVATSAVGTGLCTVFVQHTSASLVIQENADPAVLRDLARWVDAIAPESNHYEHDDEGPDDMPAHLRSAITRTSESIPITGARLALGTWQAVYLFEHRRSPHRRRVVVHVHGTPA